MWPIGAFEHALIEGHAEHGRSTPRAELNVELGGAIAELLGFALQRGRVHRRDLGSADGDRHHADQQRPDAVHASPP
jgi:hypothetical protein